MKVRILHLHSWKFFEFNLKKLVNCFTFEMKNHHKPNEKKNCANIRRIPNYLSWWERSCFSWIENYNISASLNSIYLKRDKRLKWNYALFCEIKTSSILQFFYWNFNSNYFLNSIQEFFQIVEFNSDLNFLNKNSNLFYELRTLFQHFIQNQTICRTKRTSCMTQKITKWLYCRWFMDVWIKWRSLWYRRVGLLIPLIHRENITV